MPELMTIGYGGRKPADLVAALVAAGVRTVVDVRLRPDRASLGSFARARDPARGIEGLLGAAGVGYAHYTELGNLFLDDETGWPERYRRLLELAGEVVLERLVRDAGALPGPLALLCAERRVAECHRGPLAGWLAPLLPGGPWTVRHLE